MSNNAPIWYTTIEGIMEPAKTLIDSGSSRNFLDSHFAKTHNIPLVKLSRPRAVIAIDGKKVAKPIQHKATIQISVEGRTFRQRFYVMPLGDVNAILGMTWLKEVDPDISWSTLSITYPDKPLEGRNASTVPVQIPKEFKEFTNVFSEELFQQLHQ